MSRTTQVMLSVLMLVMMTTKAWSQKTMVVLSDTHVMGPGLISHGDRFLGIPRICPRDYSGDFSHFSHYSH